MNTHYVDQPEGPQRYQLLCYGSLAFPLAAAFVTLQVIVPTFYASVAGLSLSAIGLILLLARLWDTFTDPVVGYLSDRSPARFGKRKLWVVVSAPLVCISVWMLFVPGAQPGAYYLLFWTLAIYVAGTMSIVPMNAWGAELTTDYQQRSRVTGTRVAFGLAGTLSALLVPVLVGADATSSLAGALHAIAWLVVVTLLAATALSWRYVPDNSDTTLPESVWRDSFKLLREPTPFRQLLGAFLLNGIGNAIPATLFLLFVTHTLGIPEQAGPMLFCYFICAALSVPFWVWLAGRLGKHQTWSIAIILACCFFIWSPFIPAGQAHWFYLIVIGTGFATGADLVLPSAINGDLIEWDALNTGYRRPGLFFALWGTTTKLAYALAIGIAFPLLDLLGFSATGDNTPAALSALAWVYCAPCVAFKVAAMLSMRNYPVTREVHDKMRAQLAERDGIQPDLAT